MIHSTAIVDPKAEIAPDVEIGPYSVIKNDVVISSGTVIGPHVVIEPYVTIGPDCQIFQYAAIGAIPSREALSADIIRTAAAPSFSELLLPAVQTPPSTGRSRASFSMVVSGLGFSSRSKTIGSPRVCGTATGTISSSNFPAAMAAAAFS